MEMHVVYSNIIFLMYHVTLLKHILKIGIVTVNRLVYKMHLMYDNNNNNYTYCKKGISKAYLQMS